MKYHFNVRILSLLFIGLLAFEGVSYAKSAREIEASVETALEHFEREVPDGKNMVEKARGVLIFPTVIKGGFGIGGEYGVGALRIHGKTVDYYNTIAGSIGLQIGGQVKSVYFLFMQQKALQDFRYSDGWQAGVDGSVTLVTIGADGSFDTTKTNQPIVAFVIGQKGLMYNLTLEGSKFNKIKPS